MEILSNREVNNKNILIIEKNNIKDKIINNNIINNKNKFLLFNLKNNKGNLKNINDLLALKQSLFKNKKLPILKLKFDK